LVSPYYWIDEALFVLRNVDKQIDDLKGILLPTGKGDRTQCETDLDLGWPVDSMIEGMAEGMVTANAHLGRAQSDFGGVEEEFGAVCDDVVTCGFHVQWKDGGMTMWRVAGASCHYVMLHYLEEFLKVILDRLELHTTPPPTGERATRLCGWFSTEAVIRAYEALGAEMEQALEGIPRLDLDGLADIRIRAQQELFRAWKRRFPEVDATYETFDADPNTVSEHEARSRELGQGGKRTAYQRDHLWLTWSEEEGFTPAKIRDRWNGMTKKEREEASPRLPGKIGGGEPGRDVVKKALKRAQGEKTE
jgi:hypothetical protein